MKTGDGDTGEVVEEIIRVEVVVAKEFPERAMESVRPGLDDRVDLAAGLQAELGRIVRRLYAKLLKRVDDRFDGVGAVLDFLGVESVDEEFVVVRALPIDAEGNAAGPLVVMALRCVALRAFGGARHQDHQLREVAPIERQIADRFALHHAAHLGVGRL